MKHSLTLSLLLLVAFTAIASIPQDGLVAHFPFTNGSLQDVATSGIELSSCQPSSEFQPAPGPDKDENSNSAYEWPTNYLSGLCSVDPGTLPTNDSHRSVSFWFYRGSNIEDPYFIYWGGQYGEYSSNSFGVSISNVSNNWLFNIHGFAQPCILSADWASQIRVWYHITVTYDGSSIKVYVDGALRETAIASGLSTSTYYLSVGSLFSNNIFTGRLDELTIYNKSLSQDEVTHLHTGVAPVVNTPPTITSTPITSAKAGEQYLYTLIATDGEGDAISFSLPIKPIGMGVSGNLISWTPTSVAVGTNAVKVLATDAKGDTSSQSFTLTVDPAVSVSTKLRKVTSVVSNTTSPSFNILGRVIKTKNIKRIYLNKTTKRLILK